MAARPLQFVPLDDDSDQSSSVGSPSAAGPFSFVPLDEPAAPSAMQSELAVPSAHPIPTDRTRSRSALAEPVYQRTNIPMRSEMGRPASRSALADPIADVAPANTPASPLDRTAARMQDVLSGIESVEVTAPRFKPHGTPTDRNAPRAAQTQAKPEAPWRDVLSAIPGEIGGRIEMRMAGTEEYFGSRGARDARKKLWQALVLPDAIRESLAQNISPIDHPDVIANARRLGIRPDTFTRDWPDVANLSPEDIQQIYRKQTERLRGASSKAESGKERRERAAQISADYRPQMDEWSAKGLLFDLATSIPDLLVGLAGGIAAGPAGGVGLMMGTMAPEFYAQGRNQGLDDDQAGTYAALMSLAEAAPELPVLHVISRTPAARRALNTLVGEKFAQSTAGQVLGVSGIEAASEMITETLQIGIERGMLDKQMSLGEALNNIARAGVIGAAAGAVVSPVSLRGQRQADADLSKARGELADIEDLSISDSALDRQIRELEEQTGEAPAIPRETPTAPSSSEQQVDRDREDLTSLKNKDATPGQIGRLVESGYATRLADGSAALSPAGRRRLTELETGQPPAEIEATFETDELANPKPIAPGAVQVKPSATREGWFAIEVDGKGITEVSSRETADAVAADLVEAAPKDETKAAIPEKSVAARYTEGTPETPSEGTTRSLTTATVLGQPVDAPAEPTEAQKTAGNYRKPAVKWQGLDIRIENLKGSERSGTDESGKPWKRTMASAYGYVGGSEAKDGDAVDVYIGDKPDADTVFVIDQLTPDGQRYDEAKSVVGVESEAEARALYLKNYPRSWKGLGAITAMPISEFKEWVKSPATKKPVAWKPTKVREPEGALLSEKTPATVEFAGNELGSLDQPQATLRSKARALARRFVGRKVVNESDGSEILISMTGVRHATSGNVGTKAAIATAKLDRILEAGRHVHVETDKLGRPDIKAIHHYETEISIAAEPAIIRSVVREHRDGRRYYDHFEVRKEESPAPGGAQSVGRVQEVGGASGPLSVPSDQAKVSTDDDIESTDRPEAPKSEAVPRRSRPAQPSAALEKHRVKIETAARQRLKGVKSAPKVTVLRRITDVPEDVKRRYGLHRLPESRARGIEGLYDPPTGEVYLFSDALKTPARAGWVLFHELAGHHGMRQASKQTGVHLDAVLDQALRNRTVLELSSAISRQRRIRNAQSAADEALAEIAAAVRTGDYDHIEQRYGITVPQTQRKTLRGFIERLIQRIKLALARAFGVPTSEYSDAQVYQLLADAWKAATTPSNAVPSSHAFPAFSEASKAPTFYSALLRAVEAGKLKKGSPAQWLATLKNQPGVKSEELQWTGLEEWLGQQTSPVSQDQVADFVRANQIEVTEKSLGNDPVVEFEEHDGPNGDTFHSPIVDGVEQRYPFIHHMASNDSWWVKSAGGIKTSATDYATAHAIAMDQLRDTLEPATRYDRFTTPGGEKYRELLLTLPSKPVPEQVAAKSFYQNFLRKGGQPAWEELTDAQRIEYARTMPEVAKRAPPAGSEYRSSHWEEPNVLAHIRFDERADVDGKRVLHIAEVQSDWHQAGRKQGYRPENERRLAEVSRRIQALEAKSPETMTPADRQEWAALMNEAPALRRGGVPDAPFKTTWPEFAFKRMIRFGADNGFDRITWDTGAVNADRYDLSQQVDRISYAKRSDGRWSIDVRKGGESLLKREATAAELADLVGKDIADRITTGVGREVGAPEGSGELRGLDLKVGGEGMVGFYDKILPATVNKLVKKWGAKVGSTQIDESIPELDDPNKEKLITVHALDITDAMRDSALAGQPLFSEAPPDPKRERLARLKAERDRRLAAQRLAAMPGTAYVPMYQGGQVVPLQANAITIGTGVSARSLPIPDKPIRREHILAQLQRDFDVKVYQGKTFKGRRSLLGFFRPKNFEVRTRHKNDLEVTAHEIFHWLDYTYPELRRLYREPRFKQELTSISYDATKLHEGFAEFGRLFMTQDAQALAKVPQFYAAFTQAAQQLDIYDRLAKIQDRMHQWYLQGALLRARSKVGAEAEPLAQRMSAFADVWSDRAMAESVDHLHAAKVIERTLTGTIAKDAMDSPYKSLRLLAGARNTIESFLNFGTLDWTPRGLEFTGKGLKHVFEPVAHVMDDTLAYFVGRRAQELMSYGKERLFTPDEIDAMLNAGRQSPAAKEIEQAFRDYQAYTKRLMDFAEHSGIVSRETRNIWEAMYQNYVPFYRVSETMGATRLGAPSVSNPFKKLFGGTANLNDIWDNMVMNTATVVHASMRNMAKAQLFATIEKSPLGQRFAVKIPASTESVKIGMSQVEQVLRDMITEAQTRANDPNATAADKMHYAQVAQALNILTGATTAGGGAALDAMQSQATFFVGGQPPSIPDKDSILVKGGRVWFQIADPLLWDLLSDINFHKPIGLLEVVFGAFKRTLTRGVTVTPEFQIANLQRDTQNAFTLSKGGQIPFVHNLRAMRDIWTQSEDYKLFLANGGGFGNATPVNEGRRVRLRMRKLIGPNHKVNIRAILDTPWKLLDFWDKWGQSFELGTRLAEFKKLRSKGASLREAAFEGREISSDFAMHGRSGVMRAAMISLPFFNARVQGLYRMERELFERGGRQAWRGERQVQYAVRGFLGVTMPALLLYFINKDDEDYQELPEDTKALYYPIKLPHSRDFVLIPKPFETGAIFATTPEQLWRYYETRNSKKLMDAASFTLLQTFALRPVPQIANPIVEWNANKNWRGLPIVPRSLENVEPREQYKWYTPETLIQIGKQFDVSPIKLDHFLRGYLGGVGAYLTMASDSLVSAGGYGDDPAKRLSDYPVLRRFLRESPYRNTSHERDFWDLKNEIDKTANTARKIRGELRGDDLEEYLGDSEKAVLFGMSRLTTRVADRVRDISAAQITIRRDETLTGEQKRQQLDELQIEVNNLFKEVVKTLSTEQLEQYRDALEGKKPQPSATMKFQEIGSLIDGKPRRQQVAGLRAGGYPAMAALLAALPPTPDRAALDFFSTQTGAA